MLYWQCEVLFLQNNAHNFQIVQPRLCLQLSAVNKSSDENSRWILTFTFHSYIPYTETNILRTYFKNIFSNQVKARLHFQITKGTNFMSVNNKRKCKSSTNINKLKQSNQMHTFKKKQKNSKNKWQFASKLFISVWHMVSIRFFFFLNNLGFSWSTGSDQISFFLLLLLLMDPFLFMWKSDTYSKPLGYVCLILVLKMPHWI